MILDFCLHHIYYLKTTSWSSSFLVCLHFISLEESPDLDSFPSNKLISLSIFPFICGIKPKTSLFHFLSFELMERSLKRIFYETQVAGTLSDHQFYNLLEIIMLEPHVSNLKGGATSNGFCRP